MQQLTRGSHFSTPPHCSVLGIRTCAAGGACQPCHSPRRRRLCACHLTLVFRSVGSFGVPHSMQIAAKECCVAACRHAHVCRDV